MSFQYIPIISIFINLRFSRSVEIHFELLLGAYFRNLDAGTQTTWDMRTIFIILGTPGGGWMAAHTLAGHGGYPLTLANTKSPTLKNFDCFAISRWKLLVSGNDCFFFVCKPKANGRCLGLSRFSDYTVNSRVKSMAHSKLVEEFSGLCPAANFIRRGNYKVVFN